MKRALFSAALAAALAGSAAPAGAQDRSFDFEWDGEERHEPTEYEEHMEAGDEAAELAASRAVRGSGRQLPRLVRRAVKEYEKAAELDPSAAEPHFRAAEVIYAHLVNEANYPDPKDIKRAIRHWNAYERLAPKDPRLNSTLFRRSIAYTKLGGEDSFREAIDDYEKQLRTTDEATPFTTDLDAVVISNAAELYMGIGKLQESIDMYQRALDLKKDPLYGYGLALALERNGQGVKARQVMYHHAYGDRLRSLHKEGVFFVPEGDIHAYKALGYEALGRYDRAIQHYEAFLRAQPDGRYSDLARRRLERAEKKREENRGKTDESRPRWGGW